MGAELTERMQLGLVTKTVAGMVLTFGRRIIRNLHFRFVGGDGVEGVHGVTLSVTEGVMMLMM
jgi:hypothetical protein